MSENFVVFYRLEYGFKYCFEKNLKLKLICSCALYFDADSMCMCVIVGMIGM